MSKRIISLLSTLLIVCLVATLGASLAACNSDDPIEDENVSQDNTDGDAAASQEPEVIVNPVYNFGVITDANVLASELINSLDNKRYVNDIYTYAPTGLNELSEAIFNTTVDEYIKKDVDFVLFVGDLTYNSAIESMNAVLAGCEKLKAAGIPVYITMGLCDYRGWPYRYVKNTRESIKRWNTKICKEVITPYMEGENLSFDDYSNSYSIDLPANNLRIISLDSASTYDGTSPYMFDASESEYGKAHGETTIPDSQMLWLEERLAEGNELGEDIIVTSYFPIDGKMAVYYGADLASHYILQDRNEELQNLFIKYGVKCVFNGHIQTECNKTYVTEEGSLLEICGTGLSTYPIPIKVATIYDNGTLGTAVTNLGSLNNEYLPEYISEETRTAVTTNLTEYAKSRLLYSVQVDSIKTKLGHDRENRLPFGERLLTKLCMYDEESEACQNAINVVENWLDEVNDLKIYGETDSMEAICRQYGITLPATEYETVLDYVLDMALSIYEGNFEFEKGGVNATLYKYIVYCGAYLLAQHDIFGLLNAINPVILTCDLQPIVDKVFTEDILDLKINDAVLSLFSCLIPMVKSKVGITIRPTSTSGFLAGLAVLLPLILPAFGDEYDAETEAIWGVRYKNYIVDDDLVLGQIYVGDLLEEIGADFIATAFHSSL